MGYGYGGLPDGASHQRSRRQRLLTHADLRATVSKTVASRRHTPRGRHPVVPIALTRRGHIAEVLIAFRHPAPESAIPNSTDTEVRT